MQLDKSDLKRPLVSVSAKSFFGGTPKPQGEGNLSDFRQTTEQESGLGSLPLPSLAERRFPLLPVRLKRSHSRKASAR